MPPTTIDADRPAGTGFLATPYGMTASPCPSRLPLMETQLASVARDQVQSRDVEIVTEPVPPSAEKDVGEPVAVIWHLSAVGAINDVSDELQAASRGENATKEKSTARRPLQ